MRNKISGIYRILNTITGKGYVGSASDSYHRFAEHKTILRQNRHHSSHLQHAWNKYGESNFKFEIIEVLKNPTKQDGPMRFIRTKVLISISRGTIQI